MHALSALQLLPQHIVEMIVDYVASCSHLWHDRCNSDPDDSKQLQIPLLYVCHNFRALVYSRFCAEYRLNLKKGRYGSIAPSYLRKLNLPAHHLAKELVFEMSFWSIFTGDALQQLSVAPYEGVVFPLARYLQFIQNTDDNIFSANLVVYPPEAATNIAAFIERVKEMVPNIREVDVRLWRGTDQLLEQGDVHVMDLIRKLYDLVETRMGISHESFALVEYMDLTPICNLTSVEYIVYKDSCPIIPLVRRNAQTLQSLSIRAGFSIAKVDYTLLICDSGSDGGWVEYPYLRILKLISRDANTLSHRFVPNGIVPFPCLRRLDVHGAYPFGDDVLFRGNTITLECLKFELSQKVIGMLKRHSVFTPTSHPKLQCVDIRMKYSSEPSIFTTTAEYLQFVLSMAPNASALSIPHPPGVRPKHALELEMFGGHTSLQMLSLYHVGLSFWDIADLIKLLPLLSDLKTGEPSLRQLPQGVSMGGLAEYVRSTYTPMGMRFGCWHIGTGSSVKHDRLVTCVLLLALVCPIFDFAVVDCNERKKLMKELEKQIAKSGDDYSRSDAAIQADANVVVEREVLDMAQPKHRQTREAAGQATDSVALILEGLLSSEIRNTLNKSLADICERLQSMASDFEKWASPSECKVMSEDDIYPKFGQFVLFVMACLKALDPRFPPDNQSQLLLPARKSNFVPGGSTEGYKLDLVLVLYLWDTDIDTIVTMPANTDIAKPQ
ncbi:hypothetical protein GGI20_001060 [Coemansia sp. BCRC 34301]|nr:hypothetical protein GGI20_001060 [Coemansia sp. BCRC 34301]